MSSNCFTLASGGNSMRTHHFIIEDSIQYIRLEEIDEGQRRAIDRKRIEQLAREIDRVGCDPGVLEFNDKGRLVVVEGIEKKKAIELINRRRKATSGSSRTPIARLLFPFRLRRDLGAIANLFERFDTPEYEDPTRQFARYVVDHVLTGNYDRDEFNRRFEVMAEFDLTGWPYDVHADAPTEAKKYENWIQGWIAGRRTQCASPSVSSHQLH
jgi:hypothetical protein